MVRIRTATAQDPSGRSRNEKTLSETITQRHRNSANHEFAQVPKVGLEPTRPLGTLDFESSASAGSATSA